MHILKNGIKIIDTPGIRGFGVVNIKAEEIRNYFPEIFINQENVNSKIVFIKTAKCAIIRGLKMVQYLKVDTKVIFI